MGDASTIYYLQNSDIGPDSGTGFRRVDYFALLTGLRVRNNVRAGVGSRPIDFIAVPVPTPDPAIWLYEPDTSQAGILERPGAAGVELLYVPVSGLKQDRSGRLHFSEQPLRAGLPLRLFEDPELNVTSDGAADRAQWLSAWHSERECLDAVHRVDLFERHHRTVRTTCS